MTDLLARPRYPVGSRVIVHHALLLIEYCCPAQHAVVNTKLWPGDLMVEGCIVIASRWVRLTYQNPEAPRMPVVFEGFGYRVAGYEAPNGTYCPEILLQPMPDVIERDAETRQAARV